MAASAADGSLSKLDPSFEARLQLQEPQESPESSATPRPTKDNAGAPADPAAAAASETASSVAQTAASNSKHGDGSHHPGQEGSQDSVPSPAGLNAGAEASQNRFDINDPAPAASPTASAHAASRSETPAASQPEPAPEPKPAATAAAAHDIKLELKDGNQRVEVRLTERGGDIHVSVRTPDARLSGAMREELPALTAKLEQSGFRAEAWQPGSTGTAERRAAEDVALRAHRRIRSGIPSKTRSSRSKTIRNNRILRHLQIQTANQIERISNGFFRLFANSRGTQSAHTHKNRYACSYRKHRSYGYRHGFRRFHSSQLHGCVRRHVSRGNDSRHYCRDHGPATGQFHDAAKAATAAATSTAAPADDATDGPAGPLFGASPWLTDPTGNGPGPVTHYNPIYFATAQTAQTVAQMVGGTVTSTQVFTSAPGSPFQQDEPNLMVQLPNGGVINPGLIADIYTHGWNQAFVNQQVANEFAGAQPAAINT